MAEQEDDSKKRLSLREIVGSFFSKGGETEMVEIIILLIVLLIFGLIAIKTIPGHGILLIGENKQDGTPTYAFCIDDLSKIEKKKFFILRIKRK